MDLLQSETVITGTDGFFVNCGYEKAIFSGPLDLKDVQSISIDTDGYRIIMEWRSWTGEDHQTFGLKNRSE